MANLVSFLRDIAKEELSAGIRETLPEMSPLFRRIVNSWENVQRNDIGRPAFNASGTPIYGSGWVFRWLWNVGGGGSFYFTNPNPDLIGGGSDNMQNVAVFAENADFPGVSDYVVGRYAVPFVGLCEGRGSLILPHQLLRANQLDSVVVDKVAQEIKNSADLLAHTEAVCYFSRSPAHGEVIRSPVFGASAPSSATSSGYLLREKLDGTADNYSLTLHNIGSEDQILRLRPGMTVDVYQIVCTNTTTSGMQTVSIKNLSAGSSGAFVVDVVDPVGKKATFVTKDGSAAVNPATSDSIGTGAYGFVAYVVLLNKTGRIASTSSVSTVPLSSADFSVMVSSTASEYSKQAILTNLLYNTTYSSGTRVGYAPDGLESWIKTQYSDTLYGISLARIPQVKSLEYVLSGSGDYLTESLLNDLIGFFMNQYGPSKMFDVLLTSNGVLNGFFRNLMHWSGSPTGMQAQLAQNVDRNGKAAKWRTGWDELVVSYRGKSFTLMDDPFLRKSTMYGIKSRDGNLRRLVPPRIPGSGSKSDFTDVEFIAPLGGSDSIWKHAHSSSGSTTDYIEAPFVVTKQHFMLDPCCLVIRNLKESEGV